MGAKRRSYCRKRSDSAHRKVSALATEALLMAVVPMVMTAAHLHFLVCLWCSPYERLVFIYCELRHFAQERHDIPKQFIIVRDAPGRHARHLDPMFHHPKLFCGREPSTAP